MDAPPPQEDCRPFVSVASYLEAMQINAPRIQEADVERGFLLMSDLGDVQYLDRLQSDPESAGALYDDAIDTLARMQGRGTAYQARLPSYDARLLDFELSLFHDWLCGTHAGIEFTSREEMAWRDTCSLLIRNALDQPRVFVHRDYHSRNLMVVAGNNPGVLDFQDAVEGPLTYDLVSLLRDCYITWPADTVRARALAFHAQHAGRRDAAIDESQFMRWFDLMGVQRHLKAAGIFARLMYRDAKSAYLADVPRTLAYVTALAGSYPELDFVAELIAERVLPALEDCN